VADYWSKYEFGWHWSPTANHRDAVAAVELRALFEAQRLLGGPSLADHLTDPGHRRNRPDHARDGQRWPVPLLPVLGAGRVPAGAAPRPHPREVTGPERRPGAGVRVTEVRAALPPIEDALDLVREADAFRVEFNTVRPHEALAWNRPLHVHQGLADPATPTFQAAEILPTS
jgi:hypothetical protein